MRFCATTVMIPDHDLEETARLLFELGYDGAEWRVRRIPESQRGQPYSPWGNVKNDLTPETLAANPALLLDASQRYNLAIAGLATAVRADDLDEVRLAAEGCAACGAPFFRVGAPDGYNRTQDYNDLYRRAAEAFGKALEIVRGYGVRAVVEIHRGTLTVSASLAHRLVSNFDPRDIGVIYDLSNMTIEGYECCRMGLELLGPYLAHVHAGGHRPVPHETRPDGTVVWGWEGASLAAGLMDYEQCLTDLKAVGYQGFISVEDFRPLPIRSKLDESLRYLKALDERIS